MVDIKTTGMNKAPTATTTTNAAKVKKPRQPSIEYKMVSKVEKLVREGKGDLKAIVDAGVSERFAKIAIKKLTKEGVIKQSYVVTE